MLLMPALLAMMSTRPSCMPSVAHNATLLECTCHFIEHIRDETNLGPVSEGATTNPGLCTASDGSMRFHLTHLAISAHLGSGDIVTLMVEPAHRIALSVLRVTPPSALRHRRRPILTHPSAISQGLGHATHGSSLRTQAYMLHADEDDEVDIEEPSTLRPRVMDLAILRVVWDAGGVAPFVPDEHAATRPLYESEDAPAHGEEGVDAAGGQGARHSVAGLFEASSYGALRLSPREHVAVVKVHLTGADLARVRAASDATIRDASDADACPMEELADAVERRAYLQSGLDVTSFTFREFLLPDALPAALLSTCRRPWATMARLGCAPFQVLPAPGACRAWYRGQHSASSARARAKTLAHNLGLSHATSVAASPQPAPEAAPTSVEGDPVALMGHPARLVDLTAPARFAAGLLPSMAVEDFEYDDIFTIRALGLPLTAATRRPSNAVALRLERPQASWRHGPAAETSTSARSRGEGTASLWISYRSSAPTGTARFAIQPRHLDRVYVHALEPSRPPISRGTSLWAALSEGESTTVEVVDEHGTVATPHGTPSSLRLTIVACQLEGDVALIGVGTLSSAEDPPASLCAQLPAHSHPLRRTPMPRAPPPLPKPPRAPQPAPPASSPPPLPPGPTPAPPPPAPQPCAYFVGKGVGGSLEFLGRRPSAASCAAAVHTAYPTANSATFNAFDGRGDRHNMCFAGFDISASDGSEHWETCLFGKPAPPSPPPAPLCTGPSESCVHCGFSRYATSCQDCPWEPDAFVRTKWNATLCGGHCHASGSSSCVHWTSYPSPPPASVADVLPFRLCDIYAAEGQCTNHRSGWMRINCAFTCFFHTSKSTSPPPPPSTVGAAAGAPRETCQFQPGDGWGGTEERMPGWFANAEACAAAVASQRPAANGATYSAPGTGRHECYAEFGVDEILPDNDWVVCSFQGWSPPPAPLPPASPCIGGGFAIGDAVGSFELNTGMFNSAEDCAAHVAALHPAANGVTYPYGRFSPDAPESKQCFAEYGVKRIDSTHVYQRAWMTCAFERAGLALPPPPPPRPPPRMSRQTFPPTPPPALPPTPPPPHTLPPSPLPSSPPHPLSPTSAQLALPPMKARAGSPLAPPTPPASSGADLRSAIEQPDKLKDASELRLNIVVALLIFGCAAWAFMRWWQRSAARSEANLRRRRAREKFGGPQVGSESGILLTMAEDQGLSPRWGAA